MSLKRYIEESSRDAIASEIGFYTPLATHIFGVLLGYPTKHRLINKSGKHGIPDIRLDSQEDGSEWVVVEAKLDDEDIRLDNRRDRVWREQVLERGYIGPETFYVVLCAPRTFYVCSLDGEILEAVHIQSDHLLNPRTSERFPLTDKALKERLHAISYEASLERKQIEAFRRGDLKSAHIPLTEETLDQLHSVFSFAIDKLKQYCRVHFRELRAEYGEAKKKIAEIDKSLGDIGSGAIRTREKLLYRRRTVRAKHRLAIQLFEDDYARFQHDQTYAGTQEEEHFEDIFCTNTAYVALSRLFFVRICEDAGLTTRKISNSGIAVWREFVQNIREQYQDLVDVAFKDVANVYSSLFESSVFDWFGQGDGKLHDILERILFRLNAFSFREINRDMLGSIYQSFRPRVERRRMGEYYTPDDIVDFILSQTGITNDPEIMQRRILDPACGSFTFGVRAILPLLQAGGHLSPKSKIELVRNCLRGQDINPFSVFLSHLNILFALLDIYLEAKRSDPNFQIQPFNIKSRNSLTYGIPISGEQDEGGGSSELDEELELADYVVGNPPFVRNERIPAEDRAVLDTLFARLQAGNTDLANYFLYAALSYWLKPGGILGMVAPLSAANARMARELRRFLNGFEITAVVSLEWLRLRKEIFQGIDIVPMLLFARNAPAQSSHKVMVIHGLERRADLQRFITDTEFAAKHSSSIDLHRWYSLSPTGDWPVEIKAVDLSILEKLKPGEKLSGAAKSSYGIKLGAHARATSPFDKPKISEKCLPFLKGQNICSFHCDTEPLELLHLTKLTTASDSSLWANLDFYRKNEDKYDEEGTGRKDLKHDGLAGMNGPSDTRCCSIPGVYRTLAAGWFSPLEFAVHDSARVLVPTKYSAPATCAIINSRICRYYAFLVLRSAVVQRAHCTFFPRTLDHLPFPKLTARPVKKLHRLAVEASELSARGDMSIDDIYLESLEAVTSLTKAGFLGLRLAQGLVEVDREDLLPSSDAPQLALGYGFLEADDADLELLARVSLLSTENDEFTAEDIENIQLPADASVRHDIAETIRNCSGNLKKIQDRVLEILEEIDEIVAAGLGITPAEHKVIRDRCGEFPLSVTVERPRFVWSPDRKRQARRAYISGERFK